MYEARSGLVLPGWKCCVTGGKIVWQVIRAFGCAFFVLRKLDHVVLLVHQSVIYWSLFTFVCQWDFKEYAKDCKKAKGVTPLEYWAEIMYGGKKIKSHSNIIFRYVIDSTAIRTTYLKHNVHVAVNGLRFKIGFSSLLKYWRLIPNVIVFNVNS